MIAMLAQENQEALRRHIKAEKEQSRAEVMVTVTEDCVHEDRATGRVWKGRAAVGDFYEAWWTAFDSRPETENRWAVAPDLLIVETKFVGIHKGTWLGVKPTGRPVSIPIMAVASFRDGLISGERFYWDLTNLMRQIDAAPPWPAL